MKVQIWTEQADLFEMSVLEQTAELVPAPLSDLGGDPAVPIVLIGKALNTARRADFRAMVQTVYMVGGALLITPPYGDSDVGQYLETPVGLRVVRRPTESVVRVLEDQLRQDVGAELTIRSDHVVETALGAGLLAGNPAGRAVAVRYQPRNTAGAALVTSLQILSYTAVSVEAHRQALLKALLRWTNVHAAGHDEVATSAPTSTPGRVDQDDLVTVLLSLAAVGAVEPSKLLRVAADYLQFPLEDPRLVAVLDHLESQGVLALSPAGVREVDRDMLESTLEAAGLHAYARELRELVGQVPGIAT